MKFGKLDRALRAKGITDEMLAKRLGIDAMQVRAKINGKEEFLYWEITEISQKIFGVPADKLFWADGEIEKD